MIFGLGNDIIEIERIRSAYLEHQEKFLARIFTEKEQEHCKRFRDPFPNYAGRYAAKEAIAKAFGCGLGELIGWHDIEILADQSGKPIVHFSPKLMKHFKSPKVLVSISHTKEYATAVAIWIE